MLDPFYLPSLVVIIATALLIYILGWVWPGASHHDPASDDDYVPIPFPGQHPRAPRPAERRNTPR